MMLCRAGVLVLALALPSLGESQPWAEAYKAGNHAKASELLHAVVITDDLTADDPEPYRLLAHMYARGTGVPIDQVGACSLAQAAFEVSQRRAPRYKDNIPAYDALIANANEFIGEHCDRLPHSYRAAADLSRGCYAFGIQEHFLTAAGQLFRVDRTGLRTVDDNKEVLGAINCPQMIARVRVTSVEPPAGAAPGVKTRDFIEVFSWHYAGANGYTLQWMVHELRDPKVAPCVMETIHTSGTWPVEPLPAAIEKSVAIQPAFYCRT